MTESYGLSGEIVHYVSVRGSKMTPDGIKTLKAKKGLHVSD